MSEELDELKRQVARQPFLDMLAGAMDSLPDPVLIARRDGTIWFVNLALELVFGYDRQELLTQQVEMLLPDSFKQLHAGYRDDFWRAPRVRPMGAGKTLAGRTKDGRELPCYIMLSPYSTAQGPFVCATIRVKTDGP